MDIYKGVEDFIRQKGVLKLKSAGYCNIKC